MSIAETSLQPTTPVVSAVRPHHLREWEESAVAPSLALANLVSLRGQDVLQALAGHRLEQLSGHAQQYATGAVQGLLKPLEPVATGGGWWCAGLDPLADWAPMEWGCFKPDRPRRDEDRNRSRKYEHPIGVPTRAFFLRVPACIAATIAHHYRLTLPDAVAGDVTGEAGAFWLWLAADPRLPLVITEGAKKAAALLSAGVPAVALPGVDSGAKRTGEKGPDGRRTGPVELLEDLAAIPMGGRTCWVLFDYSDSDRGRRNVARAARRLGWKLKATGANVLVGCCPGPAKGADDHLAAGGTWEQLAKCCQKLAPEPALPHLRKADLTVSGAYLGKALNPERLTGYRLLAISAPMGCGKTRLAADLLTPHLRTGAPILSPTHRTSLGSSACKDVGLAWMAQPGSPERLQGTGLCWDSFRPSSALRIRPNEWNGIDGLGPVLLLDEISQGVEHVLFGTGTAVARHRLETMGAIGDTMARLRQAIAMDAQLSEPILQLLEALSGTRVHLLRSEHRPMAGRRVTVVPDLTPKTAAQQGRGRFLQLLKAQKRVMVVTTAQQAGSTNSAQNLARLVEQHWEDARVLMIDSDTPEAAEQLGNNPNGTAAAHDVVIASPAITSGVSIDLLGHFDAVLVLGAGGVLTCEHLAQAAARVRDPNCPVWIYAPAQAPRLRVGSGDTDPAKLLKHLGRAEAALLAELVAAGGWDASCRNESPWLRCWLELAAHRNRQSFCYSGTVAALLEAEGWLVDASEQPESEELLALEDEATDALIAIRDEAQAVEDTAIINATPITDAQAHQLQKKRRLTPTEKAQLTRYEVAQRWGLSAETPPTPELLEADRDGLSTRARFGWLLLTPEARQLAAAHDLGVHQQLTYDRRVWAPDALREMLRHRLKAADALQLPTWLQRSDWFGVDDERLQELQATATAHRGDVAQALGITVAKRAITTLRRLLRLAGYELKGERHRCGGGEREWHYRVQCQDLPAGANPTQLELAWRQQLDNHQRGVATFFSINRNEETGHPPKRSIEPLDPCPDTAAALVSFFELTWGASDDECLDLISRAGVGVSPSRLLQLRGQWMASLSPLERGQRDLRLYRRRYLLQQLHGSQDPAELAVLSDAALEDRWVLLQSQ